MLSQLKAVVTGSKMPTQPENDGAKTTCPLLAVAAPLNLFPVLIVDEMSTQLKALFTGLKMPTQSASFGAKTTSPLMAVVAPLNFDDRRRQLVAVIVDVMSTQLKALFTGSKVPTQSAVAGAKTTSPLLAVVAPTNFPSLLIVDEMSTQLKMFFTGSKVPTQLALCGAKTTIPLLAVVAP